MCIFKRFGSHRKKTDLYLSAHHNLITAQAEEIEQLHKRVRQNEINLVLTMIVLYLIFFVLIKNGIIKL